MKNNRKATLVVVLVAVILAASVGGTLAYLATKTDALENIFQPVKVTSKVEETMSSDGLTKSDVAIKNTGDIPAYLRAAVVITWQNDEGNVLGKLPEAGVDYTITYPTSSKWTAKQSDGFYYYTESVASQNTTEELIDSITVNKVAPESGYKLHVEVIGSAIQASGIPGATYQTAWSKAAE